MPFKDVLTFTDTEEQQDFSNEDSSDEESDKRDEAIKAFTECSDLGENFALVEQGAKTEIFKIFFPFLNDHLTQEQS